MTELTPLQQGQTLLTSLFSALLSDIDGLLGGEAREIVEHYVDHREFGIAFDRLFHTGLLGQEIDATLLSRLRSLGDEMKVTDAEWAQLVSYLGPSSA